MIRCEDEVWPGVFKRENAFLFLTLDLMDPSQVADTVFAREETRRHPNVAVLSESIAWRYDIYAGEIRRQVHGSGIISVSDLFRPFDMKVRTRDFCKLIYSFQKYFFLFRASPSKWACFRSHTGRWQTLTLTLPTPTRCTRTTWGRT